MNIRDAMVWWNDNEEHQDYPTLPQIKVLNKYGPGNSRYSYLTNSIGGCFAGWEKANPVMLAVHLLAIYAMATGKDGVSSLAAHQEFMRIDEYRDWIERNEGPFADAYWSWEHKDAA